MTLGLDVPETDFDFGDESRGQTQDLHALFREWRAEAPARRVRVFGQPAVALLSYEFVADGFRDESTLPAATSYIATSAHSLGRFVSTFTGDEHKVRRAILTKAFRRNVVPRYTDLIRRVGRELVAEMAPRGHADLVTDFTKRFPLRIISRLLDLPTDREDATLATMAMDLIRWSHDPEKAMAAKDAYVDMVTPLIEQRRAHPGDDLISVVVTAEVDGERFNDDEVHAFIRHLFPAGADTTYLALGNVLRALLTEPALLDLARENPETRLPIIKEAIRWDSPVANLPRSSPPDRSVVWHGMSLPPSTPLVYSIMSANRDENAFPDADKLDPARKLSTAALTFGLGSHLCAGLHLAYAELEIALDTLLGGLPGLRMAPGAVARDTGTILRGPAELPVLFHAND
ncbi:cytochrome P450 [Amycolatopsis sp. GM8]|uniref:cytochrome P450 n=1 Tax=Amycolatopsis sp. GM8 TaxID=2896530 RepID=UPI001F45B0EE|nr:cytochrome P450 [Amycolatopsis sp. GM8]